MQLSATSGPQIVPATSSPTAVEWEHLTGRELGDALGLPTQAPGCGDTMWSVEVDGDGSFCLDLRCSKLMASAAGSIRIWSFGRLWGYEPSPQLTELVGLWEEFQDLHAATPDHLVLREVDIWRRMSDLRQEMEANGLRHNN